MNKKRCFNRWCCKNVDVIPQTKEETSQTDPMNLFSEKKKNPPEISVNTESLRRIIDRMNFSRIISAEILLNLPSRGENRQKIRREIEPEEKNVTSKTKYHVHGDSIDMMTQVESKTRVKINASDSNDFDVVSNELHAINQHADGILRERYEKMSQIEKSTIDDVMKKRKEILGKLIEQTRQKAQWYEDDYQRLIEEFVKKIKLKIVEHLDLVQDELKQNETFVFQTAEKMIKEIHEKTHQAKSEMQNRLQQVVRAEVERHLSEIHERFQTEENRSVRLEKYKTLDFRFYATNGNGILEDPTDLREDLKTVQSRSQIKRTVYVNLDGDQSL